MTLEPVDSASALRDFDPGAVEPGTAVLETLIGQLELGAMLLIAAGTAEALAALHDAGLAHSDVRPLNILVNLESGRAWLAGAGSANPSTEAQAPKGSGASSLAYVAPERTGRLAGSVDARADLYSLGVSLYQLATGKLPFVVTEPAQWLHAHLAVQPIAPRAQAEMPEVLERILLKLLEKEPDDRYQTAAGLAHDLRECRARLQASGDVASFPLGRGDAPVRLLRRTAFHGRATELELLTVALERVRATGTPEIVLVSGHSGVGKSSLVRELLTHLPPGTLIASGKFEDREQSAPYAAITRAFGEACRWLLAKPPAVLEEWKAVLLSELGSTAGVVTELVPELQLVLGTRPVMPSLPANEAQGRLHASFRLLLRAFAVRQPPLLLFLDDLQWVDAPSLSLIEQLLLDQELCSVLLLGTYRVESVPVEHPLQAASARFVAAGRSVATVVLPPLASSEVGQLVADLLLSNPAQTEDLASIVEQKTGGNPFFVRQFLSALVEEQLVTFDAERGAYVRDWELIAAKGVTDNLTALLLERLARLPVPTQRALELLACLGGRSSTALLADLMGVLLEQLTEYARVAVRAGVVVEVGRAYAFAHDRLLAASYSRIPEHERLALHLRIGRALRARPGQSDRDGPFEVVRHLNRASRLLSDVSERIELAQLNLEVARRSRAAATSATVGAQLELALGLLPDDRWQTWPELTFDLEFARAESKFLCGQHVEAAALLAELTSRSLGLERLGTVVALQVTLHCTAYRFEEALEVGLGYLRAAGVPWGVIDQEEIRRQYEQLRRALGTRQVGSLTELPALNSPTVHAVMKVCDGMLVATRSASSPLLAVLAMHLATLSIEHGNTDISCFAYATLSIVLGPYCGEHELGLEFGKLGGRLAEVGESRFVARARLLMGSVVAPRAQGAHAGRAWLLRARDVADKIGDLVVSVFTRCYMVVGLICAGAPLEEIEREARVAIDYASRHSFVPAVNRMRVILAFIRGLREPEREPGSLSSVQLDEDAYERGLGPNSDLYYYWHWRVKARYYAGRFTDARAAARRSRELAAIAPTSQEESELLLFGSLAETACADPADPAEALAITSVDERELWAWAQRCPAMFSSKAAIVSAERARLAGREMDAQHAFEHAAQLARQYKLLHDEALAHELAARFYAERGITSVARAKWSLASECYLRWGALAKVAQLETLADDPEQVAPLADVLEQLDMKVLVTSLEAVSRSLDLETLIQALLRSALQHAAAERGLIVLLAGQAREPRVRARASSTGATIHVAPEDATVAADSLPESILRYVLRSAERVSTRDDEIPAPFRDDCYFDHHEVRSLLCLPIVVRGTAVGAMYLESSLARHSHSARSLALLELIASQAAISLENAQLYAGLQEAQQRMGRAERVSRMASFSFRPQTRECRCSEELSNIYGLDGPPTLALLRERTHPDDRALFDQMAGDPARYEGQTVELRLSMPDGTVKHVAIISSSLGTDEYAGTIRDVTEAKQAEEALQHTQAALTDMARIASLAEMSAAIAHEVNQPVTAIGLDAGTCLRRLSDDRLNVVRARSVVERIQRDANRAGAAVQRLRALFRKTESLKIAVGLNEAIAEVAALARTRIRAAEVTLTLDLAPGLPATLGDRVQLQQVVMNLLNNALDAMSKQASPRRLTIRTLSSDVGQLLCEVQDSGPGLSDVQKHRIFEPFYTTKLEGMGIGLSICRNILSSHGGELAARNNTDAPGATFYFILPCGETSP